MEDQFTTYGTAGVMVANITYADAEKLHDEMLDVKGVQSVEFDETTDHYARASALFTVTFDYDESDDACLDSLDAVKELLSGYNLYVSTDLGNTLAETINAEVSVIMVYVAAIVVIVLILTSRTFGEVPVLLLTFVTAMLLNQGSNFLLGKISFVSNSVTSILQLALSLDYAVILCNRFKEEHKTLPIREAAIAALSKAIVEISASSLTTIGGLCAMLFMQFKIGPDTLDTWSQDNGQDVFLVEGDYDGAAQFSAQALAKSTEDFAPISRGLTSAISHYLKSASWYRLPSTPINRDVEEQWHLTLPQDGSQTHTVHYTSPENEIENVRIYTRQNGSWEQADCEIFGDYLTFEISGTEADVAAVTVLPVWWVWLALGLVLLAILILLILFVRKLIRKKRAGTQAPVQETPAAEASDAPSAPAPEKKRRWIWLVIVLAVLVLAAAYFIFCGGDSLKAYHALETLNNSEKLSMDVTVDAALDSDTMHTDATLQRKTVDGHLISYVQIEGVPLCYTDGAVILENGKAYQIHESFPTTPRCCRRSSRCISTSRQSTRITLGLSRSTAKPRKRFCRLLCRGFWKIL